MSSHFTVTWFENVKVGVDEEPRAICFAKRYDALSQAAAEDWRARILDGLAMSVPDKAIRGPMHYSPEVSEVHTLYRPTDRVGP